jgi:hypothetical protein
LRIEDAASERDDDPGFHRNSILSPSSRCAARNKILKRRKISETKTEAEASAALDLRLAANPALPFRLWGRRESPRRQP